MVAEQIPNDPFQEGLDAFEDRKPNPYPTGSPEHQRWQEGYDAASDGAWDAWSNGL